jgi:hypothetical protein
VIEAITPERSEYPDCLSREEMLILCDRKARAHGYTGVIDFVLKNPDGVFEVGRDQELAMMVGLPWGD